MIIIIDLAAFGKKPEEEFSGAGFRRMNAAC